MGRDDWYRNTTWDEEVEAAFFRKLERARSRPEGRLIIQANTLVETRPDVTLSLIDRYFATRDDKFDDASALQARGDAFKRLGCFEEAIDAYVSVLKREEEFPNVRTNTSVELPYLIAFRRLRNHYPLAESLLAQHQSGLQLPTCRFMREASRALLARERRQFEIAKVHAHKALHFAGVEHSGLRYHPKIGLVGNEFAPVILRLKSIVTGYPEPLLKLVAKLKP